jgi:DNA-binding transcriptional LysR family regulator
MLGAPYDNQKTKVPYRDNVELSVNLRHIQQFLAVAETGSIRAAARGLGLSQPAITKAIRQLERECGVPLIQRNTSGAVLTAFGRTFRARAQLIAGEARRAQEELAQMTGDEAAAVAIGASPSVAALVIPAAIPAFLKSYPKARVRIVGGLPNTTISRVCDGTLDFVVGPRPRSQIPSSLRAWPLFEMPMALTLRTGHRLSNARSLVDFADAEWILTGASALPDSPLRLAFDALGLPPPRYRIQAESFLAALSLIAHGDFVGLMPRAMVEAGPNRDHFTFVEVPELDTVNSVELFYRPDPPLTPAALNLAEHILRVARSKARSLAPAERRRA